MKTTKLVLGILGLIFSVVISFQSCAGTAVTAITESEDSGPAIGFLVAVLLIAGSIVMIATRGSTKKGGSVSAMIILLLAGLFAFLANSELYGDLVVWGALCLIYALINLISIFVMKKKDKQPEENQ